eukprot:1063066-Pelagomonas_calceolata.AAC.10
MRRWWWGGPAPPSAGALSSWPRGVVLLLCGCRAPLVADQAPPRNRRSAVEGTMPLCSGGYPACLLAVLPDPGRGTTEPTQL